MIDGNESSCAGVERRDYSAEVKGRPKTSDDFTSGQAYLIAQPLLPADGPGM